MSDIVSEHEALKSTASEKDLALQRAMAELADLKEKLRIEKDNNDRLKEEFSKQEKFYTDVFNSIQDMISILDTDLNIVGTNTAMELYYPEILPLAGKKCYWAYHHHDSPCDNCPSLETIRTGKPAFCIIPQRDSFGVQTGWEELYTFPWIDSTNGKLRGVIEFVRDITNIRKMEDDLAKEKELLSVTMASIGDGVVSTDTAGTIVSVNPVALTLCGKASQDAIGKPVDDVFAFFPESSKETSSVNVRSMIQRNGIRPMTMRCGLRITGQENRVIDLSLAPINDSHGSVIGMVMVVRDMTERLKLENEFYKSSKIESLGVLAGGIAHDFNNILAGIIANISVARMKLNSDAELSKLLAETEKGSFRASKLVKQLLTFSKGGAPIKESVAIKGIIEDAVGFSLSGSNVSYKLDLATDLANVEADRGQIDQVLNNLIINAVQSMPQGGTITIGARNERVETDELHEGATGASLRPGEYVRVSVKDEGIGIEKAYLEKIFDPYFTTKPRGNGLGLAIVYSIVKAHKGAIHVDSALGKGTTIWFYLPVTQGPAKSDAAIGVKTLNKGNGQRILILDDDALLCTAMANILEVSGYCGTCTATGTEALAKYEEAMNAGAPFSAVIMDLTIPGGMGGKDAVARLLKLDPKAKIIVSSGYSNDPTLAHYRDYGFCGVIPKPFKIEDFLSAVKNACDHPIA